MNLFANLKGDLRGGITAAAISIPQCLGYGLITFASLGTESAARLAILGLYAAIFSGLATFWGSNPIQVNGPKAPTTIILAAAIAVLAGDPHLAAFSPDDRQILIVGLAAVMVFLGGLLQVMSGWLRFGTIIKYIPYPVVCGFMNGIAILLIEGQIKVVLGIGRTIHYAEIFSHPDQVKVLSIIVGLGTLGFIFLAKRYVKTIPSVLAGLLAGTALYYLILAQAPPHSLGPVLGSFAGKLPMPVAFPNLFGVGGVELFLTFLPHLLITAVILALVGSMDTLLSAVATDNLTGCRHHSNKELVGQGLGNMLGSLFGAIFSAGSIPRAMANFHAGGRTPLSGVICSLALVLVATVFSPLVAGIPLVVLGAIIICIGIMLFDSWTLRLAKILAAALRSWQSTSFVQTKEYLFDFLIIAAVTIITSSVNLVMAVGAGVIIASVRFMTKMSKSIVNHHHFGDMMHSHKIRSASENERLTNEGKKIAILELKGPLFFGSAESLVREIEELKNLFTYCILDLKMVSEIDSTGYNTLLQIHQQLQRMGKHLLISHANGNLSSWRCLEIGDLVRLIGANHFFPDTDTALEWGEEQVLGRGSGQKTAAKATPLERTELASGLTPAELEDLKTRLVKEKFRQHDVIIHEGAQDRDLFILIRGAVSVKMRLANQERFKRLVTYAPGVIFGEMALLDGHPRSADVWAEEDCEAMRLPFEEFENLRQEVPEVAIKILRNIALVFSRNLRQTSHEMRVLEDS